MELEREKKVADIKDEIEQGRYRVDPKAVADAILRRLRELATAGTDLSNLAPAAYRTGEIGPRPHGPAN